jgi:uncharacterized protein (TIGR02246 family)
MGRPAGPADPVQGGAGVESAREEHMTTHWKAGCAIGVLAVMTACAPVPAPPPADTRAADEKTIRDGETAWVHDLASRDVERAATHYTDDATVMAPGMAAMKGKNAIREGFTQLFGDGSASLTFVTSSAEVARSGDLAYTQGTYVMTMTDPKTKKPSTDRGTYVTVYKKEADGSWKAVEDISTSGPAEAPPPAAPKKT